MKERCTAAGNTALKGAIRFIGDKKAPETVNRIVAVSREIILADHPQFPDKFMQYMDF